ncbi:MAG TPA: hypothetical protein PKC12_05065 [Thiobacillaceae bacterium]|nr:hypothetical protein [Thiobacillaceae bacterium]
MHSRLTRLRASALPFLLITAFALAAGGCIGPRIGPAMPDAGWDTSYEDALSPHTQLALGVMRTLKEEPETIPPSRRGEIAQRWQKLADLIRDQAPPAEISRARLEVEAKLDKALVDRIKEEQLRRDDLMGFMMSSGVRVPKGGMKNLNPDHIAATKTIEALNR